MMHGRFSVFKKKLLFIFFAIASLGLNAEESGVPVVEKKLAYVIPIEGPIGDPQLYILRRGLKQAMEAKAEHVVIRLDTPGGQLDTTLKIMEVLQNFQGTVYAYVDREAISAGAYIAAAANTIYFHTRGIMGAAAVIESDGGDVNKTLKMKIDSYLKARIRDLGKDYRYRGDVIRAMMDEDFEFRIGGKVIKKKGSLLTLTASEAVQKYGTPPEPLMAKGIVDSVERLLNQEIGADAYTLIQFKLTWSEKVAKWLNQIRPLLLGIGLLCLFIEFKSGGGFGFFGVAGIAAILVVFTSSYVAGLAGYESLLIFAIGIILVGLELFLFPGTFICGILGASLIIGSLVWGLSDVWPGKHFQWGGDIFVLAIRDVILALVVAIVGGYFLAKYFFKKGFFDKLLLKATVAAKATSTDFLEKMKIIGKEGKTLTELMPTGKVIVEGNPYEAFSRNGFIRSGELVRVVDRDNFRIIVTKILN